MINSLSVEKISKIIGFEDDKLLHIKNKLLRDALHTKGNNRLNPYKNRARRWSWPVIILDDQEPPAGWKEAELRVQGKGKACSFKTKYTGWGCYVKYETWSSKLDEVRKNGCNISTDVGRFKIGIPYEEAAKEQDCALIVLMLAYQAHRILGKSEKEIEKNCESLIKAVEPYPILREPKCPFCKNELSPDGFVEITDDTTDVFYKRKEAEDNAIQMFHIECLKPGKFLHKPGNVSWGHRRCNVAIGQHDVLDAEKWFVNVLQNRGWKVSR